jgi:hypothetical protein
MADFAINDASTSCKHPGQAAGQKCTICGKMIPTNPSASPEEWKAPDAENRPKNS